MKNMKKQALFGFLLLTIFSCKSLDDRMENADIDAETYNINTYFTASGNDPFWSLQIENDTVKLKSVALGQQIFKINSVKPLRASDSDVKMLRISTDTGKLNIQIVKGDCENTASGIVYPYFVTTEIQKKDESKSTVLNGCGHYITDQRLNDIWVLEQIKGKKVTASEFQKELPKIEINTNTNHFTGYAGCNQINGSIFFEKDILRFSKIVTTKMMCQAQNREAEFLKTLESSTSYFIANNRLWLADSKGTQLVFRKVD
ncbi:MAG: META domain-containing protein [Flavobacterium sp.]